MARPSTITREEVFAAVAKLVGAGEYPNPSNVRRLLDSRGSPPLVQRYIGQWYAENGPELTRKIASKPPPSPMGGLQAEMKRLAASAVKEIENAHEEREEQLKRRAAELESIETNLKDREAALARRELEILEQLNYHRAQEAEAREVASIAQRETHAARAELYMLREKASELAQRLDGSQHKVSKLTGQLESEAAETAALQRRLDAAGAQIKMLEDLRVIADDRLSQAQQLLDQANNRLDNELRIIAHLTSNEAAQAALMNQLVQLHKWLEEFVSLRRGDEADGAVRY